MNNLHQNNMQIYKNHLFPIDYSIYISLFLFKICLMLKLAAKKTFGNNKIKLKLLKLLKNNYN